MKSYDVECNKTDVRYSSGTWQYFTFIVHGIVVDRTVASCQQSS